MEKKTSRHGVGEEGGMKDSGWHWEGMGYVRRSIRSCSKTTGQSFKFSRGPSVRQNESGRERGFV